jgi:purine-binding chemotaxis protein CheW
MLPDRSAIAPFAPRRGLQRARGVMPASDGDVATLVSFTIGNDMLSAPVEHVERVLRYVVPSSIPNLPEWLEGIIDYRGRMVPVVDLRKRLSRTARVPDAATRIVVFATQPEWLAAIVDSVSEVLVVDAASIALPPALVRGLSGEYLRGMVTHGDAVLLVLDIGRLLSATETLSLAALHHASISE